MGAAYQVTTRPVVTDVLLIFIRNQNYLWWCPPIQSYAPLQVVEGMAHVVCTQVDLSHCGGEETDTTSLPKRLATVRSFDENGVNVVLPCGELRRLNFQLEMPSPDAIERLKRWSKLLKRCEQKSIWIRFLGGTHIQQQQWSLSNDSVLLEQCLFLHSQDSSRALRIFETFCGSFGGWSI